jgi:hypothetical protein
MSLYKYVPPERLDVLRNLRIRFTQPGVQNDPFELRPFVDGFSSPAETAKALHEQLEQQLPAALAKFPKPFAAVAEVILADRKSAMLADAAKLVERTHPQLTKEIFDILGSKLGILSLSETPASPSMWDRYAAGYSGFVIEFDDKHPWFWAQRADTDDFRHLRKVAYVDTLPSVYLTELSAHDVFYSKAKEWEHEREWRVIRPLEEASTRLDPDVYLFDVPPECIRGVIEGTKTKPDAGAELLAILGADPNLKHVRTFRAHLSARANVIEIIPAT